MAEEEQLNKFYLPRSLRTVAKKNGAWAEMNFIASLSA
jgi:hypothetical protein